jgi:hypothetical protein
VVRVRSSGTETQGAALASVSDAVQVQQQAQEQTNALRAVSLEAVTEAEIPGIFSFAGESIGIASATPQQLDEMGKRLNSFLNEPKLVASIVRAVGDNVGKYVANLAGFTPVDPNGIDEEHFLLFGRVYMPEVEGCRAVVRLSRKETRKGDFKLSLAGFGGGAGRVFWCEMAQADELLASPKDLVIPIKARVVTWKNSGGKAFFTYSVVSCSRWIAAVTAKNPFFGASGYSHLAATRRDALKLYGGQGLGIQERNFDFGEGESYKLKGVLSLPYGWTLQVEGSVEIISKMSVFYSLVPTHDYLLAKEEECPVEHYWAWKESSTR